MENNTNKALKEGYDRLKKILKKIIKPNKEQSQPQLVLQPIRNPPPRLRIASATEHGARPAGRKKYLSSTDLHYYCALLRCTP